MQYTYIHRPSSGLVHEQNGQIWITLPMIKTIPNVVDIRYTGREIKWLTFTIHVQTSDKVHRKWSSSTMHGAYFKYKISVLQNRHNQSNNPVNNNSRIITQGLVYMPTIMCMYSYCKHQNNVQCPPSEVIHTVLLTVTKEKTTALFQVITKCVLKSVITTKLKRPNLLVVTCMAAE